MNKADFMATPRVSVKHLRAGMTLYEGPGQGTRVHSVTFRPTCSPTNVHVQLTNEHGSTSCYFQDAKVVAE